jgi:ATP-dependent helicase Lhr and Lhr-like helicase
MNAATRIKNWYKENGWVQFQFQRESWRAYFEGKSGLIHSPTGSGKSLAAWLGPVSKAIDSNNNMSGLQVLWITPLRALANDMQKNLQATVKALDLNWRVEIRTGDTSSSARIRQRQNPPQALITTPESLTLLLSYADAIRFFSKIHTVIVDEWHELIGSKRGVQLELCMARLRAMHPQLQTWGLSATLGNIDEAMHTLIGNKSQGTLIEDKRQKITRIKSVLPQSIGKFPWAGHLGLTLLPQVITILEKSNSTLLFTNTRSQAEIWFEALTLERPDLIGKIALHHGSIDRKIRNKIEEKLRLGELRCVVCTSSLDLGVDFSPVDQVLQIGSPKGVARLLQRAGRSGHQPGATSRILCVPTHAFELIEIVAARHAAEKSNIESRSPLRLSLDVLSQHLITIALGTGFEEASMRKEIASSHAFKNLKDQQWQWVLDFITRGGQALQGYPQYHKVVIENERYYVKDNRIALHHRMNIGTITSDSSMRVCWMRGGMLGHVEENFISRLVIGDIFLFAGRLVKLKQIKDMTVYVQKASQGKRIIPRWQGGRMAITGTLADSVLNVFGNANDMNDPEIKAIAHIIKLQKKWSRLPDPVTLLFESVKTREGHSLFGYPFGGRLVHEGLATLLAYRLSKKRPITFKVSINDYGFELLSKEASEVSEDSLREALSSENLSTDLLACINTSELARRHFRDIARISGLIFQGYPGYGKTTRQLQASSSLIYDVLKKYDHGNLLLDQAQQEVLENQLDVQRLSNLLERINKQMIVIEQPHRLTPLAFPLWAERLQSHIISSETWKERVLRMVNSLEKAAIKN